MDDTELSPLNENIRKLLQFGVVLAVLIFLFIFFLIKDRDRQLTQKTIYLEDNILNVFDQRVNFSGFPDQIIIHQPYFIIVKPQQQKSYIYNLKNQKLERQVNKIVLDYAFEMLLYNRGSETIFNKTSLKTLCEQAIIKSKTEIFCVPAGEQNQVVLLSTENDKATTVYQTKNLISEISYIDNKLYIGEINVNDKESFVVIDNQTIKSPDVVNVIYKMDDNIYISAFQSPLNKNQIAYCRIYKYKIIKQSEQKIFFYK